MIPSTRRRHHGSQELVLSLGKFLHFTKPGTFTVSSSRIDFSPNPADFMASAVMVAIGIMKSLIAGGDREEAYGKACRRLPSPAAPEPLGVSILRARLSVRLSFLTHLEMLRFSRVGVEAGRRMLKSSRIPAELKVPGNAHYLRILPLILSGS